MPAYKDKKTGKWYASFYYANWKGVREKKMKRGFETKKAGFGLGKRVLDAIIS